VQATLGLVSGAPQKMADKKNRGRDPVLSLQLPLIKNYEAHLFTAGMQKSKITY